MKKNPLLLLTATAALAVLPTAALRAQSTYYWDGNGSTSGFGTATGTWADPTTNNSTQGWSTSLAGTNAMNGTTSTTTSDDLNFGTSSNGLSAGTITVSGTVNAGNLTFGSASGAINLSGGTINLGSASVITVNNSSDTISSILAGAASSLTKAGTGTLTLSGANTFNGAVTVSSGALSVNSISDSAASALGNGTSLTLGQGTAFYYTVGTASTSRSLILTGSTGSIMFGASGSGPLTWSGNITNQLTSSGFIDIRGTSTANNTFSGVISDNGSNTLRVIKNESGKWIFSGNNTFTSSLDMFDGTLSVATIGNSTQASNVGAGGTIRFGGFGQTATLEYTGAGNTSNKQFKLGGGGTTNSGGTILNNGTGALVFNNAAFNSSGDGTYSNTVRELTLGGSNTGNNTISGVIANNGGTNNTVSVNKTGTGLWILSGNNTYTAGTTISAGTLQIGAGGTSGSVSGNITNNGDLVFNRSDSVTLANTISGTGNLTQAGSGALTLSGANTFSGGVIVGGSGVSSVLYVNSISDSGASALGTGSSLTLGQISRFYYTGSAAATTSRSLILTGTTGSMWFANDGNGSLTWSGNITSQLTTNTGSIDIRGTSTANNTISGVISDNGSNTLRVIKNQSGKWVFSGNNTFTGLLDLFDGTLSVATIGNSTQSSNAGAGGTIRFGGFGPTATLEYTGAGNTSNKQFKLGGGGATNSGGIILNNGTGALVFNNAAFNSSGDGTYSNTVRELTLGGSNTGNNTISGVIADNGGTNNTVSVNKTGTGLWILSGNNTYTGGTTVSAGTLIINGNNTAANGAFSVASGATLGGSGTIGGATTINGNLSPGDNGPGVLKFNSSLTLTSTANTTMELNGVVRGSGYDGINVLGPMVYNGSLTLNFGSLFLSNGATFNLFSMTGGTTTGLTGVNFSGAYGSGAFTANGTGQWINTSNGADWAFTEGTGLLTINVVPEPGTWALLTISLAWLLLFRVRPRTSAKRGARASHL